jgi:tetratricopeptide (TPR) repeat protein
MAEVLNSLSALYAENGMYEKAARLHHRMTAILGAALSRYDAARLQHSMASVYYAQRKYSEAEPLFRAALKNLAMETEPYDRERALLLNNLAVLSAKTGRRSEAISILEQSLSHWEKVPGYRHSYVARVLANLAGLYLSEGRPSDAERSFLRALVIAENSLGRESLLVATILTEYVVMLRKAKRKSEAAAFEKEAQFIRQAQSAQYLGKHTVDVTELSFRDQPSERVNGRRR